MPIQDDCTLLALERVLETLVTAHCSVGKTEPAYVDPKRIVIGPFQDDPTTIRGTSIQINLSPDHATVIGTKHLPRVEIDMQRMQAESVVAGGASYWTLYIMVKFLIYRKSKAKVLADGATFFSTGRSALRHNPSLKNAAGEICQATDGEYVTGANVIVIVEEIPGSVETLDGGDKDWLLSRTLVCSYTSKRK